MGNPPRSRERDAAPGDIVETGNGNRYLVLGENGLAYLGNREPGKSDLSMLVRPHPSTEVVVIGRAEIWEVARSAPPAPLPAIEAPFHDHGGWKGPCSPDRHALVLAGGPPDRKDAAPRGPAERARFTLDACRLFENDLCCACCRVVLLDDSDPDHLERIVDLLKAAGYPDKLVRKLGLRLITRLGEEQGDV